MQGNPAASPTAPAPAAVTEAERLRALFGDLIRLLNDLDRQESACCGVTVAQCLTLTTLRSLDETTPQQLGQTLGLAPSTVTRAVAPLHDRGWVARRRDPADRRQVLLTLTPLGAALAERLEARTVGIYDSVLAEIPAGRRAAVLDAMDTLLDACRRAQRAWQTGDELDETAAAWAARVEAEANHGAVEEHA